jgi:hypothetical protein
MSLKNATLIIVGLAVCVILLWLYWPGHPVSPLSSPRPQSSKPPMKNPLCILAGDMLDTKKSKRQGFEALGNFVRIRFGSNQLKDCTEAVSEYCRTSLNQGFIPGNLGVKYRESSDPETKTYDYVFDRNCNLQRR